MIDNFDLVIIQGARVCMMKDVEYFLHVDSTDCSFNKKNKRKIEKLIESKAQAWSWYKMILVACLIICTLAFTACLCIPDIRNAVIDVVISWKEDHIEIEFHEVADRSEEASDGNETQDEIPEVDTPITSPPTSIQSKAFASYVPDLFSCTIDTDTIALYAVSYYDVSGEIWKFSLMQSLWSDIKQYSDSEMQKITNVQIGEWNGLLIESLDCPNYYSVIWCDQQYTYTIYGAFADSQIILDIASGVKVQK